MSEPNLFLAQPRATARSGFEAAARAHEAARARSDARPATKADPETAVRAAIADAARRTGVDFGFLLAQAEVESAMHPGARAPSSSATGLYQFIESTWLGTVKRHGARFGLGALADEIALAPSGAALVADPARRQEILALRSDPQVAALMAAGLADDNRAHLAPILGRQPSHAELYLAHFLGAAGAGRFLSAMQQDPGQSAAALFARPAAANRAIFYAPDGSERSLAQVMDLLSARLERALGRSGGGKPARPFSAGAGAAPIIAGYGGGVGHALAARAPDAPPDFPSRAPVPTGAPMSQVIRTAFGLGDGSPGNGQVRRAYDRLRALGL